MVTENSINPVPCYSEYEFRMREVGRLMKIIDGATINATGTITQKGGISDRYHAHFDQKVLDLETAAMRLVRSARAVSHKLREYTPKAKEMEQ